MRKKKLKYCGYSETILTIVFNEQTPTLVCPGRDDFFLTAHKSKFKKVNKLKKNENFQSNQPIMINYQSHEIFWPKFLEFKGYISQISISQ